MANISPLRSFLERIPSTQDIKNAVSALVETVDGYARTIVREIGRATAAHRSKENILVIEDKDLAVVHLTKPLD